MKIKYEIEINEEIIEVEFESFPEKLCDGIGSYEFWGTKGFDKGRSYISIENSEPTWNKSLYSAVQNIIIEKVSKSKDLSDCFIEQYINH